MKRLITTLLCLVAWSTSPVFAGDYLLKLEMTTEVESKVGDGKPTKTNDVRTLEILITPDRRFHGRTTWENQRLTVRGKLTDPRDGTLTLNIDCKHTVTKVPRESSGDGRPPPGIENHVSSKSTIGIIPRQPIFLGGTVTSQTTETLQGRLHEKQTMSFRITLIEDDDDES